MTFGIQLINANSENVIDQNFRSLRYMVSLTVPTTAVDFCGSTAGYTFLEFNCDANYNHYALSEDGINITTQINFVYVSGVKSLTKKVLKVWSSTTGQTLAPIHIYTDEPYVESSEFGLAVYNPAGVMVFNSVPAPLDVIAKVTLPVPSSTEQFVTIPNSAGKNIQFMYPKGAQGLMVGTDDLSRCGLLRKVSNTQIGVKLVPYRDCSGKSCGSGSCSAYNTLRSVALIVYAKLT